MDIYTILFLAETTLRIVNILTAFGPHKENKIDPPKLVINNSNNFQSPVPTEIKQIRHQVNEQVNVYTDFYERFKPTKFQIALAASATCYCTIVAKILLTKKLLTDSECWHAWKLEMTMDQLLEISPDILTEQLMASIRQKYSKSQNFIQPLLKFSSDIQSELSSFERHLTLTKFVKTTHLYKIIPETNQLIIKDKIQKLKYLKTLFNNWSAQLSPTTKRAILKENRKRKFSRLLFVC